MKIERTSKNAIMIVSTLFVIFYSGDYPNTGLFAQLSQNPSENISNLTSPSNFSEIQNDTDSITDKAIPYVLNATTSSNSAYQAVDEVIKATGGDRGTAIQQVIDASSKGNLSVPSLEWTLGVTSNFSKTDGTNNSIGDRTNVLTSSLP